jgi:hypothetical protein
LRKSKQQIRTLVGCLPLTPGVIGFAIPVFRYPDDPSLLAVQEIDELNGRIRGFRILEDSNAPLISVPRLTASVGDDQVYAFISSSNAVHVGSLQALRPSLASFAEANFLRHSIIVQIKELIGTGEEKKVARARMRKFLLEEQGAAAARSYYEGSVLRSILWNCLLCVATDSEMAKRILLARGQLSATVKSDGTIALDLSALSEEDQQSLDHAELIAAILLEFEPAPDVAERKHSLIDNEITQRTSDLVQQISRTGRQEDRIALLISAILTDPSVGKSALMTYQNDRAQTAAWALNELRKVFVGPTWDSDEKVIVSLLPRLFKQQWPMTRGDLLLSLAKHLGKWPRINRAIQDILEGTRSAYVDMWREEIKDALSGPKTSKTLKEPVMQNELFKR